MYGGLDSDTDCQRVINVRTLTGFTQLNLQYKINYTVTKFRSPIDPTTGIQLKTLEQEMAIQTACLYSHTFKQVFLAVILFQQK